MNSAISGAAGIWNNCGSAGIPGVLANASGSINVEVIYVPGQSTRDEQGGPTVDSNGNVTGGSITIWHRAANGFEALDEFDVDRNSLIDARDPIWDKLMLWRDYNHDGVSQPDEIELVARSVMSAVSLRYHWTGHRDRFGNTFRYQSTVWLNMAHGRERSREARPVYDIFFVRVH